MIFHGFRVFQYALWQKTKTRKRKSTKSFLNQKIRIRTAQWWVDVCFSEQVNMGDY